MTSTGWSLSSGEERMSKTYDLITRWSDEPIDCKTRVGCTFERNSFIFTFDVDEAAACFRQACRCDGDPCWEDSCVEVFLQSGRDKAQYFNFECSSSGAMLGEVGVGRGERRRFSADEYGVIKREATFLERGERVRWRLKVAIPAHFIGVYDEKTLRGNLYKCGSKAACVHYQSAFDIGSDKPDFHRPESFRAIFEEEEMR